MQLFMLSAGISDAALITQIENRLKQSFGTPNVRTMTQLHGVDGTPPDDEAVRHTLVRSDVVLVLLAGHSILRLSQSGAPDHFALRLALDNTHIRVIPALLHNIAMPERAILPADMQALADLNAVIIREKPHFEPDMTLLVDQVNKVAVGQISGVRSMFHDGDALPTKVNTPLIARTRLLMMGAGGAVAIMILLLILWLNG